MFFFNNHDGLPKGHHLILCHWWFHSGFPPTIFPTYAPTEAAKARDFQPMRPRDSRETTLEVPEDQEPGGPPGMAKFLGFKFLLTQKNRWPWNLEGWWRMNLMFHLCFFKVNHRRGGLNIYSGWQCCWMFVWEGSIVKVAKYVFFLGAWRKDQEKHVCYWCTCMNVKDTSWYSIMTYRLWSLQGLIKYDTMYIT